MSKKLICLCFILAILLCSCSKSGEAYSQKLKVKLDNYNITVTTSKDYLLSEFNDIDNYFSVFYNDEEKEYDNFAICSFIPANAFEHFKSILAINENVLDVYENTDDLLYYAIISSENKTYIEYNRLLKLNDDYILYIGSFDKDAVDTFYETVNIDVK